MKNIYLHITIIVACITVISCRKQDIKVFGNEHIMYFKQFYTNEKFPGTAVADSIETSFYFEDENVNSIKVPIPIILSGKAITADLKYKIEVDKELTTALPEEYTIEQFYIFKASDILNSVNEFSGNLLLQINRSKRTDFPEKGYRIVITLVESNIDGQKVLVGQKERRKAIIHVLKDPVKPEWWTKVVSESLLGEYSPLKYKLFLTNVANAKSVNQNLIKEHPDEVRKILLEFKKWLRDNPTQDQYGDIMTIPV